MCLMNQKQNVFLLCKQIRTFTQYHSFDPTFQGKGVIFRSQLISGGNKTDRWRSPFLKAREFAKFFWEFEVAQEEPQTATTR